MIEIVHPAPFLDTVELVRGIAGLKAFHSRLASYQVAGSDSVGFVEDGRLLAAIGFWPLGDGRDEVYLVGLPREIVGPRLLELSRLARLTIAARLQSGTVALVGFVRIGHEPGERLARLAGFHPVDGAPSGFTRWELTHGRVGQGDLQRRE